MWKFQYFSPTHISHEINFAYLAKTAIFTILPVMIFEFMAIFNISKYEIFPKNKIQSLQNC